ncbi:ESX secretion-associated protein EspG [Hoyosella subflava]|uniref:ESX secretion-associated protein EspG n=1 Tax=Hoyosella subflava (strain DSM 45089 / JCM 17490 / NBRC 109087 / DQS3-9A1) TaxID=443218 RepID=F6EKU5_HOYSD|nr:ESX secretion-associated protein EspG [Hoyosella subflava]AEF41425.1 hypothetical protein AS9A_2978 [Hoyosella subflava DQS3-9A1]
MHAKSWNMTGLELSLLIFSAGRDRLPYPLQHPLPGSDNGATREELATAKRRLERQLSHDLEEAALCLLEPEKYAQSVSFVRDGATTKKHRAIVAARGGHAGVAVQEPGASERHGGDVVLRLVPRAAAAQYLVASLPDTPAGLSRSVTGRMSVAKAAETTMPKRLPTHRDGVTPETLFSRRRTAAGEVVVGSGPTYSTRVNETDTALSWIDIDGDGRYLVRSSGNPDRLRVFPADGARLTHEIRKFVA